MKVPSLRKKSRYYCVKLHGKEHYLGKDKSAAEEEYRRRIALYLVETPSAGIGRQDLYVKDIAVLYLKESSPFWSAGTVANSTLALEEFVACVGNILAAQLNAQHILCYQHWLADKGLSRSTVKKKLSSIRSCIREAAEKMLIPAEVWHSVNTVRNLRPGRSNAKEPTKRKPADLEDVSKILPFLPKVLQDMLLVQLLCGMRPGEARLLRVRDIIRHGEIPEKHGVWLYILHKHKTAKVTGETIVKYIGKRCQTILQPYLDTLGEEEYLFSPKRSET